MSVIAGVRLWGNLVGAIDWDEEDNLGYFEYDPRWLASRIEVAPLQMPLSSGVKSFPQLPEHTFRGLPGVFADTLPDDFGNAVIDQWLARKGQPIESFTPAHRLLYQGDRGMGALEYEPVFPDTLRDADGLSLDVAELAEMAQEVLDARAGIVANVSARESDGFASLVQVGTSAGGARPKAVVAVDDTLQTVRSGQVTCPHGFKHYILKFDGVAERASSSEVFGDPQGYGRMEYAYHMMAKECGIDMMPCHLLEEGGRAHFLTQRFDRDGDHKRHYQSLCAMAHADYKAPGQFSYEQILQIMRQLRLPRHDADQLFRRMVFNVVARNHDDHTKNFGFLLNDPESDWRLAPAFDVAFSYKPGSRWVNQHQISVNGKRDGFTRKDLLSVADQILEFRAEAGRIIDQVVKVVSEWPDYARQASVPKDLVQDIQKNLRTDIA